MPYNINISNLNYNNIITRNEVHMNKVFDNEKQKQEYIEEEKLKFFQWGRIFFKLISVMIIICLIILLYDAVVDIMDANIR